MTYGFKMATQVTETRAAGWCFVKNNQNIMQGAKKVVSDSPGLVDFGIGLVNSVLNLPDGQAKIFRTIKITN